MEKIATKKRIRKPKLNLEWTLDKIKAGIYVIRNTSPKGSSNLDFARTVVFKVGYRFALKRKFYGLTSCLTDGWYYDIGSKEDLLFKFKKEDFRPLTKKEYLRLIKSTTQGFVENFLVIE